MTTFIVFRPVEPTSYEFCCDELEGVIRIDNCVSQFEAATKLRRWLNHLTHTDGLETEVVSQRTKVTA